jgi:hypothetical protein
MSKIPSKRDRKEYNRFRKMAVQLAKTSTKSLNTVAKTLEMSPSTLKIWCVEDMGPRVLKKTVARGFAMRGTAKGSVRKKKGQLDMFKANPPKESVKASPQGAPVIKTFKMGNHKPIPASKLIKVYLNKDGSLDSVDADFEVQIYRQV